MHITGHNLNPELLKMHSARVYNLISAVRGPDIGALHPLKHLVTERIRYIVFQDVNIIDGLVRTDPLNISELNTLRDMPDFLRTESYHHFIVHLALAVEASIKHPIWGGLGYELKFILQMLCARER